MKTNHWVLDSRQKEAAAFTASSFTHIRERNMFHYDAASSFPTLFKFSRPLPQTEPCGPKIERLCWSRSCRAEAFVEWVILLIKLSKTSRQSSCAVIALISQRRVKHSFGLQPFPQHTIITPLPLPLPPSALHIISLSDTTPTELCTRANIILQYDIKPPCSDRYPRWNKLLSGCSTRLWRRRRNSSWIN